MKLHLGCGKKSIPGWVNVDTVSKHADLKIDIKELSDYFENSSIDEIYTCHVFEHFDKHEYKSILNHVTQSRTITGPS